MFLMCFVRPRLNIVRFLEFFKSLADNSTAAAEVAHPMGQRWLQGGGKGGSRPPLTDSGGGNAPPEILRQKIFSI